MCTENEIYKLIRVSNIKRVIHLVIAILNIFVAFSLIFLKYREYLFVLRIQLIQLIIPALFGLLFYFYKKAHQKGSTYKINGPYLQYINFDTNQFYRISYSDISEIRQKNDTLEIYLIEKPLYTIWNKKRKNKLIVSSDSSAIYSDLKDLYGWDSKLKVNTVLNSS
ncbi:hypothetical protein EDC18_101469 [Natranaerovirga pectinivora]|uniref:Uncharacterized protein n=1 Tax=Natranaerovirga pectinivora TaxID=682400 RepID=A0A4R3MPK7_9FIRM|nr:hypothetical protein [Natranaerovirga pectinivora]TCT17171.1 hypothetical protein EDC18_101469 [Natranaerovirga pectinivora]